MKRFFLFLILLAIAAGVGYWWWEQHSARVLDEQVRNLCSRFVVNYDALDVTSSHLRVTGLREGKVASVKVSGKDLELANGPTLAEAELQVNDLTIEGPPFRLTGISGGTFRIVVRDKDVTSFVQNRGLRLPGVSIPMKGLSVSFGNDKVTTMKLSITLPIIGLTTISAGGELKAESSPGKVDFIPDPAQVSVGGKPLPPVLGTPISLLNRLNPVINTDDLPFVCELSSISTREGEVTLSGNITGTKLGFGF